MAKELDLDDGAAWAGEKAKEELRILRQSEREGWRYASELEQERKRLQEIADAAQNMCRVKGRYHSEQAMRKLMLACGFETPNAEVRGSCGSQGA